MKRSKLIFTLLITAWLLLAAGLSYGGYWFENNVRPQMEYKLRGVDVYTSVPPTIQLVSPLCYLAAAGALIYGPVSTVARWRSKC